METTRRRRAIAWGVLAILGATALAAYLFVYPEWLDLRRTVEWAHSFRGLWWTPAAFLLAYAVATLFALPVTPLSIMAALIWGWLAGGLVELIAATLASLPPFLLARATGGEWIRARLARHPEEIRRRLEEEGWVALLVLRLTQIIPYGILNYAAGAANLRPLSYAIATAAGMIPPIFIFAFLVDSIVSGASSLRAAFGKVAIAGALIGALVLLSRAVLRRWRAARGNGASPPAAEGRR